LSGEARSDPVAAQRVARERCPVAWTEDLGGFWSVLRYDDVVAVARDTLAFSNALRPRMGRPRPPLETDRPDHTYYRRLLQPHFSPQRMRELEPRVRGFVVELLEPLLRAGGGDVAPALTYPLPARVVCELLNVPDEDWPLVKRYSDEVFEAGPEQRNDPGRVSRGQRAALRVHARARPLAAPRAARPRHGHGVDAARGREGRRAARRGHDRRDPAADAVRRSRLDNERARGLNPPGGA
jgi:cytochrome P450